MTNDIPSISALLVAPAQTVNPNRVEVSIGLQLDNEAILWTNCNLATHLGENFHSIKQLVDRHVAPLLTQRSIGKLQNLIEALFSLERTVRHEEMVTPEPSQTVSRRQFISRDVDPQTPQPELVITEYQKLLPSSLVGSIIVLLIKALAQAKNQSPVEILAELYHYPLTKLNPRPTHFKLPNLGDTIQPYSPTMVSMGYAILPFEDEKMMGKGGEIFQKQVRKLKTHVRSCQPKGKYLYFELLGAYGRLYDNQVGRILGACSGLAHSVKPCTLYLEDVILMDDEAEQAAILSKLKDYLRLRKLKVKLVTHFGVDSVTAVQQAIEQKTAHGVRLSLHGFKSLSSLVEGMKTAVSNDMDLILGDLNSTPELLAWLGILFQPRLLYTASPYVVTRTSTEMYQTAMELNRRAGII